MSQPVTPQQQRDLRSITADGVFFSAMVGLGETYVPAFALAVGLGAVIAGLVSTVPMLIGAFLQLVTPLAVRRLRSYRRWVVLCACLQALSLLPLVVGASGGGIGLGWIAAATVAYWAFGMATGPAWNAWVTSLVSVDVRARFFARRSRLSHIALFATLSAGGLALEWGRRRDAELALFAALFALALLARLVSARFLWRQSEAPGLADAHRALAPREIVSAIRSAHSGRVLLYLVCMQAVVHVAAPYFTPYMLGPLALSYVGFMALTGAAFLARVAVLPLLGRLAHARGTRVVLGCGALGIVPLPLLWLVSHDFTYLLILQLWSGAAWAALEFATMLSFFEGIDERDRASVLSAFNVANAAAVAVGALAGGALFSWMEGGPEAYALLFALSVAGRIAVLRLLRGTEVARHVLDLRFRTLAVRPSAGAVERPILATVGGDVEVSSADEG